MTTQKCQEKQQLLFLPAEEPLFTHTVSLFEMIEKRNLLKTANFEHSF